MNFVHFVWYQSHILIQILATLKFFKVSLILVFDSKLTFGPLQFRSMLNKMYHVSKYHCQEKEGINFIEAVKSQYHAPNIHCTYEKIHICFASLWVMYQSKTLVGRYTTIQKQKIQCVYYGKILIDQFSFSSYCRLGLNKLFNVLTKCKKKLSN